MTKRSSAGEGNATKKLKLSAPGSLEHLELPSELEGKINFKPEVKTSDNQPWNMKIISWNVNGIRAVVKSGKLAYLKFEDPDIICLQETKCADADIPEGAKFQGYHRYFNAAVKKGYSSTALFSKVKPLNVTYGIDKPEHDNEGRVITAEYAAFYLVNVYVPNSGQKLVRLDYRRTWNNDFLAYCKKLDSAKPVIVAGDLNVAHTEIDLARPKTNLKSSGFTPQEREDFSTWLQSGFIDSYRHFHQDIKGAYTFWTYMNNARARNIGWRLDYFVTSKKLINNVAASEIRELVMGSDHCPIMLLLASNESGNIGQNPKEDKIAPESTANATKPDVTAGDIGLGAGVDSANVTSDDTENTVPNSDDHAAKEKGSKEEEGSKEKGSNIINNGNNDVIST